MSEYHIGRDIEQLQRRVDDLEAVVGAMIQEKQMDTTDDKEVNTDV